MLSWGATPRGCRCLTTFGSHHFRAFVADADAGWLRFDDVVIESAGAWADILAAMVEERMCPALMFYERV